MIDLQSYLEISKFAASKGAAVVAVSKTKPVEDIQELYNAGHRDFGENYVQELETKQRLLPEDINWHFIGHLQTNKVRLIAPFVYCIHGIDSGKLLNEVNKQAAKNNRVIPVLLQVHIAREESKFGFSEAELEEVLNQGFLERLGNIEVWGLMGMASFTDKEDEIRAEFAFLNSVYQKYQGRTLPHCRFSVLSMGMSGDYKIALEEGSTLIRIGSLLFGSRQSK